MEYQTIKINEYKHYTEVRLNRPEVRNAMNGQMLDELIYFFNEMHRQPKSSLMLLRGEGEVFSAGADLKWMARAVDFDVEENVEDSRKLYQCFDLLNRLPVTTIAWLNGPAVGGAIGLASASDFVWVAPQVSIRFSEVKLGLVPATVAPFVLNRIGRIKARQWMLTSQKVEVDEMLKAGFADEQVTGEQLPDRLEYIIESIKGNDLHATRMTSELIENLSKKHHNESEEVYTARIIAEARTSDSAQQRIRRFLSSKNLSS
ncbi:putative polyketide biosynthesis enoyl-CoA hydratase PksH [Salinivirga cyanobacteriivorans]|uniref:Putative polyketide biosynthesis enoyl-CoA hydratase PksH n=1 Tax=Salinivirga cyanobacteriivorans TaxID=1307839 RepID=A0A0S2HXK2_9BACT|nr:enoyl-CoA hydratase-related protein [Salinivirga cyanobacteriivorans]ALO14524.1 putative polyketide biosynthesis enoyl-CoA hydratase PksH [Salinivirga cyanobacteriivorans]